MTKFNLPDLGEGLAYADIVKWHVNAGDYIAKDQKLVTVETAKSMVDIPSPISGTVNKILVLEHQTAKTGELIVIFNNQSAPSVVGDLSSGYEKINFTRSDKVKAQPAARALAKHMNIDLKNIKSANNGLITIDDILNLEDLILPANRRHMCLKANQSNSAVATTVTENININKWYKNNDFFAYFVKCLSEALLKNSKLNAHYKPKIEYKTYDKKVDLGIAMQNDKGLFVPNIYDADKKNIKELRQSINQLKTDINNGIIKKEQMQNATFVVSNFGSLGNGLFATPMLHPPSVGIIALGKVHDILLMENNAVKQFKHLPISLTFDHRVVYGAEAIRLIKTLKDELDHLI